MIGKKAAVSTLTGLGVLILGTTAAEAQSQAGQISAMNAPRIDGFSLSAFGQATYDDNLLRLSNAEKSNSAFDTSDLVTSVLGDLNLGKRVGRQQISATLKAGYVFHKNNTLMDNDTLDATLALNWALGARCGGAIAGEWHRRQSDFESLAEIVKSTQSEKAVSGYANCMLGSRIAIALAAETGNLRNEADVRKTNNRDDLASYASLRFIYRPESYLGISTRYSKSEYPERPPINGETPEFNQVEVSGELNHKLGAYLTVGLAAGYVSVDSNAIGVEKSDGFSGYFNLGYDLGGRHNLELNIFKAISPMASLAALYAKQDGVSFGVTSSWTDRFTTRIDASYDKRKIVYSADVVPTTEGLNTDDQTYSINGLATYDLGRLISLGIGGRITKRNSTLDPFDYTAKSVFASLRVKWN